MLKARGDEVPADVESQCETLLVRFTEREVEIIRQDTERWFDATAWRRLARCRPVHRLKHIQGLDHVLLADPLALDSVMRAVCRPAPRKVFVETTGV
jgi:hypothetical protein